MKKGSITVFISLLLSVVLLLVTTTIYSVRVANVPPVLLKAVDVGLFSEFGKYDKKLLDDYDVFALDASNGGNTLDIGKFYDETKAYINPIIRQNNINGKIKIGGISGFLLLTDNEGEPFFKEAVNFEKKIAGLEAISKVSSMIMNKKDKIFTGKENGKRINSRQAISNYKAELNNAKDKTRIKIQILKDRAKKQHRRYVARKRKSVKNPLYQVTSLMNRSLLSLVLSDECSNNEADLGDILSHRNLQSGFGYEDQDVDNSLTDLLLFQKYIKDKFGSYKMPKNNVLRYGEEYVLEGKSSDRDNLGSLLIELLLIREGINIAGIIASPELNEQTRIAAATIASVFLVPPAEPIIEAALNAAWAFAESIVDLRALFKGNKIPTLKNQTNFNLSLNNIGKCQNIESKNSKGLNYENYIQILMSFRPKNLKIKRTLDLVEMNLRKKTGRDNINLDNFIVTAELSTDFYTIKNRVFKVKRDFTYINKA